MKTFLRKHWTTCYLTLGVGSIVACVILLLAGCTHAPTVTDIGHADFSETGNADGGLIGGITVNGQTWHHVVQSVKDRFDGWFPDADASGWVAEASITVGGKPIPTWAMRNDYAQMYILKRAEDRNNATKLSP